MEVVITKNTKYLSTNPISRYLISNFLRTFRELIEGLEVWNILDVGSGEAVPLSTIQKGKKYLIDIDLEKIKAARNNVRAAKGLQANIYALPFLDASFDLVLCSEVLEHLQYPDIALKELERVTDRYCIISVPREPLWRILNIMRGAYLSSLGNPDKHISHWGVRTLQDFVLRNSRFYIDQVKKPIPWIIMLLSKRRHTTTTSR